MTSSQARVASLAYARPRLATWVAVAAIVVAVTVVLAALAYGGYLRLPASGGSGQSPRYNVTFSESGLPSGTSWSVTLAGNTHASSSSFITFAEGAGQFLFQVRDTAGYYAEPSSGVVAVNGSAIRQAITFSSSPPPTYTVTFRESGLPPNITWAITIEPLTKSTNGRALNFTEPNGAYAWSVGTGDVQAYFPSPGYGTVIVNGQAVAVMITFYPTTQAPMPLLASEA